MKLLLSILLAFTVTLFPENIKKIRLFINNNLDRQKVFSLSVDLEHTKVDKEGGFILYVDENEFQAISNSGLNYEILIDDWKAYYHSLPKLTQEEKEMIIMKSEKDFG
ncbi:MAG: hypothetical protein OQJ93_10905, partial [Ignavibacteriaceae bacterium]|nr:hypothetical protein [Ignavibacteriaceae bacterium]